MRQDKKATPSIVLIVLALLGLPAPAWGQLREPAEVAPSGVQAPEDLSMIVKAPEAPVEQVTAEGDPVAATRSWLRPETSPSTVSPASEGLWGSSSFLLGLLLVAGVAGGAIYLKYGRGPALDLEAAIDPGTSRVVSTTRLSPKGALVTARIGRRLVLLGVTEHSISNLGWLEEGEQSIAADALFPEADKPIEETVPLRAFHSVLGSALDKGEDEASSNVASILAGRTRDVVGAGPRGGPLPRRGERVESQVAGLLRRRR